ncbi:hypothetical protein BGZ60DRAFT_358253, partial [Tricladium varicosporioides]
MNILETQVTDLNYLAESPIDISVMTDQRHSSSAESPADTGAQSGKKRKVDETNGNASNSNANGNTHTRAKRNRYISIACNECKRRKIKCNGNTPCQRCGNLNLECQYAPNCCTNGFKESEEFRQMNAQLATLQQQVDDLYASMNALRSNGESIGFAGTSERSMPMSHSGSVQPISPLSRNRPTPRHPSYRGPTSSIFSLDVAKTTLQNMGYQGLNADEGVTTQDDTPIGSPPAPRPPALPGTNGNSSARGPDPLWSLNKDEMIRLCRVYEEEMGIMYPVVNIEQVITHGTNLYTFLGSVTRNGLANSSDVGKGINDENSCVLKMVLACATLTEGSGQSEIGFRLFDSVRENANRILHGEPIEVKNIPFVVLVAI